MAVPVVAGRRGVRGVRRRFSTGDLSTAGAKDSGTGRGFSPRSYNHGAYTRPSYTGGEPSPTGFVAEPRCSQPGPWADDVLCEGGLLRLRNDMGAGGPPACGTSSCARGGGGGGGGGGRRQCASVDEMRGAGFRPVLNLCLLLLTHHPPCPRCLCPGGFAHFNFTNYNHGGNDYHGLIRWKVALGVALGVALVVALLIALAVVLIRWKAPLDVYTASVHRPLRPLPSQLEEYHEALWQQYSSTSFEHP